MRAATLLVAAIAWWRVVLTRWRMVGLDIVISSTRGGAARTERAWDAD
jgi:hypothetical protein